MILFLRSFCFEEVRILFDWNKHIDIKEFFSITNFFFVILSEEKIVCL